MTACKDLQNIHFFRVIVQVGFVQVGFIQVGFVQMGLIQVGFDCSSVPTWYFISGAHCIMMYHDVCLYELALDANIFSVICEDKYCFYPFPASFLFFPAILIVPSDKTVLLLSKTSSNYLSFVLRRQPEMRWNISPLTDLRPIWVHEKNPSHFGNNRGVVFCIV